MDIQQKLSQIPKSPGVYFFRDGKGSIIFDDTEQTRKQSAGYPFEQQIEIRHTKYKQGLFL